MAQLLEKALGGKYEVLQKVREGGMGAIYKVRHRLLDEVRVIKVLRSELAMDDSVRQRFQNEAKFAIQLRHPHIAHLYDFSVSADRKSAFIVMEFIDGVTLQELIADSGPPSLGLALDIATQALDAIGYLHERGFVHRDIAPDNLMLTKDFKGNPHVKLIDLGIAKGQEDEVRLTQTGMFMGKVRYSPPELFRSKRGPGELDERSDLYSFGVLLYEMLTGQSPIEGETFSEIVAGHLFRPPIPFEESDPENRIPSGLRRLCLRALEKEPDNRAESAEELTISLRRFRDLDVQYGDELERAIDAAAEHASERRGSVPPTTPSEMGQFGYPGVVGADDELDDDREEAVRFAAAAIRKKATGGDVGRARQDLRMAVRLLGQHEDFDSLERLLSATPASDSGEWIVDRRKVVAPPARKEKAPTLDWLSSPLGLLLVVGVVLVGAGLLWALTQGESTPEADDGRRLYVRAAEPWEPEAAPIIESRSTPGDVPVPPPEPTRRRTRSSSAGVPPTEAELTAADEESLEPTEELAAIPPQDTPVARRGELFGPDPGVTPPALIQVPTPVYPPRFEVPRDEVQVLLEVLVSEDGHVITAKIAPRESARRRFKDLALETVKGATFEPATKYGIEGKMWTTVRVRLPPPP